MKQIIFILTIILLVACGQNSDNETKEKVSAIASNNSQDNMPVDIAIQFINAYVDNCNKMKESIGVVEWVNSTQFTTNRFNAELKKMMDEANQLDPEMGLDADPIVDAQDYPESGFELESFDDQTNYIVVKGKDMADFKLTMKMTQENNKWLVDGCGSINIPTDKRIAR
jgi:hypothetical protein